MRITICLSTILSIRKYAQIYRHSPDQLCKLLPHAAEGISWVYTHMAGASRSLGSVDANFNLTNLYKLEYCIYKDGHVPYTWYFKISIRGGNGGGGNGGGVNGFNWESNFYGICADCTSSPLPCWQSKQNCAKISIKCWAISSHSASAKRLTVPTDLYTYMNAYMYRHIHTYILKTREKSSESCSNDALDQIIELNL